MAKLTIDIWGGTCTAEELAEQASRIADMISQGFTSGEVPTENSDGGWWSVEEVDDMPNVDGCTTCYNAIETRCSPCDECGAVDEDVS